MGFTGAAILRGMEINAIPSPKLLSLLFDFPVPAAFVTVMKAFWEVSRDSGESVEHLLDDLCGFYPDGEDARYQQTPPELFPIGRPGADGIHYGYVIHAPERVAEDYPMGELCPMDLDGVISLGRNTREAFETLLSNPTRLDSERIAKLSEQVALKLGYELSEEKADLQFAASPDGELVIPQILGHERHVMTADGIGVLADRQLFRPDNLNRTCERMDEFLEQSRIHLEEGFPASALVHLREGYWEHWTEDGAISRFGDLMRQAYEALGRPLLADLVQRRTRKYA